MSNVVIDEAIEIIKGNNKENLRLIKENMRLKYEVFMLKSVSTEVLKDLPENRIELIQTYTREVLRLIEVYKTEKEIEKEIN